MAATVHPARPESGIELPTLETTPQSNATHLVTGTIVPGLVGNRGYPSGAKLGLLD
jgi:hypothetical protein